MSVLLVALVGCGSFQGLGPDAGSVAPGLEPMAPARGAFVAPGEMAVNGLAPGLTEVRVNGVAAQRAGEVYQATVDVEPGIQVLAVDGTDAGGGVWRARTGVLAGEFAEATGPVPDAVQLHLGPDALAEAGPLLEELLDPSALAAGLGGGAPLYDDGSVAVYLSGIEVPEVAIDAVPRDGFLELTLWLPGLNIPLDVETSVWFIPVDLNANIRMEEAAITGQLFLAGGGGDLDVSLRQPRVHVRGVELDIDGLADFFEDLIVTDRQVEALLADNLEPLERAIPGLVADLLADLDLYLALELDLLGAPVTIAPAIGALAVHPGGVDLAVDLDVEVAGQPLGPGALTVGAPDGVRTSGLAAILADDAVNRALYEVWEGDLLRLALPVEGGSLEASLLALFGGDPAAGGQIRLCAGLPPVLVQRDGQARLQLAEWQLAVDTPGGTYGDVVEVVMGADVALDLVVDEASFGARLSDARIALEPVGDSAEAVAPDVAQIEQGLAAGIGLANTLLSFPLADLGIEGSLPPVVIARSEDGRATRADIELAGWTP